MQVTREQVLRYRVHVQELDRTVSSTPSVAAAVLDLGVQATGGDGAEWALQIRGYSADPDDLFTAWTLRGAPHVYRRSQAAMVARAVAPWSEADATKRIFDAAKPLREHGVPVLQALDTIAGEMRAAVAEPMVKGDLSGHLARVLPVEIYQRHCGPCDTVHLYEQPFRLSALRAGLELLPDTSPPVLKRIPNWPGMADDVDPDLDLVRGVLHLLGPATPRQAADYIDSPVREVKQHWPADVRSVLVDGEERSILADDAEVLTEAPDTTGTVRLLGPFDLFLQGRDRELLVPEETSRKELWRPLGRPGGVLVGHEIHGSWRPRASGKKLRIVVSAWAPLPDLTEQAELLAASRGATFDGFMEK